MTEPRKKLSLQSASVMSLALVLIAFGQGIAYYAISGLMLLLNVKLSVPQIVFWLQNMPYFGLVPQIAGAIILVAYLFTHNLQDMSLLKKQFLRVSIVLLCVLMVAGVAFESVPLVKASMIDTVHWYLQSPLPIASMYAGLYGNSTYFCINGSNWQNFAASSNYTLIESYAVGNTSSGNVWLDDMPFNYNVTVPVNVSVTENLNGLQRVFVSAGNSMGSPYTVSVDNVTSRYYLAQDRMGRFISSWVSTNATTVINNALGNLTSGRTWKEKIVCIGNFTFSNSLSLATNYFVLELQGKFFLANGVNNTLLYVSGHDIEIEGGTYDGDKAGQTAGISYAIDIASSYNVKVNDVNVLNGFTDNLAVLNSYNVVVDGGTGSGAAYVDFITDANCQDVQLDHLFCYSGAGVEIHSQNTTVSDVHVYGSTGVGVYVASKNVQFSNLFINSLAGTAAFFADTGAQNILIDGLQVPECLASSGVQLNGNTKITNFDINGANVAFSSGIVVQANHCSFSQGNITNFASYGIGIVGNYTSVSQVTCYSDGTGIGLINSNNCTVEDNDVSYGNAVPISLDANSIQGNKIKDNQGFVTQNWGSNSTASDGGLQATGLVGTPIYVIVTSGNSTAIITGANSFTAYGFKYSLKNVTGTGQTGQTVTWYAVYL